MSDIYEYIYIYAYVYTHNLKIFILNFIIYYSLDVSCVIDHSCFLTRLQTVVNVCLLRENLSFVCSGQAARLGNPSVKTMWRHLVEKPC